MPFPLPPDGPCRPPLERYNVDIPAELGLDTSNYGVMWALMGHVDAAARPLLADNRKIRCQITEEGVVARPELDPGEIPIVVTASFPPELLPRLKRMSAEPARPWPTSTIHASIRTFLGGIWDAAFERPDPPPVQRVYVHTYDYATLIKFGRPYLIPRETAEDLRRGWMGNLWAAQIPEETTPLVEVYVSPKVAPGSFIFQDATETPWPYEKTSASSEDRVLMELFST